MNRFVVHLEEKAERRGKCRERERERERRKGTSSHIPPT